MVYFNSADNLTTAGVKTLFSKLVFVFDLVFVLYTKKGLDWIFIKTLKFLTSF